MLKEYEALKEKYSALYGSDIDTIVKAAEEDGFDVYKIHRMSRLVIVRANRKTGNIQIELCLNFDRQCNETLCDIDINMVKM